MRCDPRLYLVTDPALCAERGVRATVEAAVRGGVTMVQLRDPGADPDAVVRTGRDLVGALRGTGVPLIVNDHVDLVAAIGADGAHVGQGDLDPVAAREVLGPHALLGLSVHDAEELAVARDLPEGTLDLLGVGPLRATPSKPDHAMPRGLEHLATLAAASPWPCVAIGGVGPADVAPVRRAGLAGVAVVRAVCGALDPEGAARHLRGLWAVAA